jgi:hypothetical protein
VRGATIVAKKRVYTLFSVQFEQKAIETKVSVIDAILSPNQPAVADLPPGEHRGQEKGPTFVEVPRAYEGRFAWSPMQ